MTLTLRIDNMHALPDGGPIEVTSTGQPIRAGRKSGNDWVLPDPSNWISGFHFEIARQGADWYLTDKSSNGTFLVGQPYRLDGPYRLQNGDRLQVGHYFIACAIAAAPAVQAPPPVAAPAAMPGTLAGGAMAPMAAPPAMAPSPAPGFAPSAPGLSLAPFASPPLPPVVPAPGPAVVEPVPGQTGIGIGVPVVPSVIGVPAAPAAIGVPDAVPPAIGFVPPGNPAGIGSGTGIGFSAPPVAPAGAGGVGFSAPPAAPAGPAPGHLSPPVAQPGWGAPGGTGIHRAPPGAAPAFDDGDPWAVGPAPVAVPVDPLPRAPASDAPRPDFGDDFLVTPAAVAGAAPTPFPQAAHQAAPPAAPAPQGFEKVAVPPAPPVLPTIAMPAPDSPARPEGPAAVGGDAFLRAFCEGAGISAASLPAAMTETLAHEVGRTMRIVAAELMLMLQDRATAKRFTKGGERTMISTENNNPLKFLPDASQALEAMFLKPRAGFLKGGDGVAAGLADVRLHQAAVFAAIQPALARLLSDLAPEAIDDGSEGTGILGTQNKKRLWDTYVERWDAKAAAHDNGMLDVFLAHFSESYAAAVAAARKPPQG